jgi:hypothetical protein
MVPVHMVFDATIMCHFPGAKPQFFDEWVLRNVGGVLFRLRVRPFPGEEWQDLRAIIIPS